MAQQHCKAQHSTAQHRPAQHWCSTGPSCSKGGITLYTWIYPIQQIVIYMVDRFIQHLNNCGQYNTAQHSTVLHFTASHMLHNNAQHCPALHCIT